MNMSFSGLTVDQINDKLLKMPYADVVDLLAVYQCPVTELALRIAQAQGLKVPKKNEPQTFDQIALCQIVYSQNRIADELIRHDKVIEGILKDIQGAALCVVDKLQL